MNEWNVKLYLIFTGIDEVDKTSSKKNMLIGREK